MESRYDMERFVWKAKVLPGKLDEYIRRHDEIWPEMIKALNKAGIHNYSIWNNGDELFGYYECENLIFAQKIQAENPTFHRWKKYMADVMVMETSPETEESFGFTQIFHHK